MGDVFQQPDVFRCVGEIVVANQHAERFSALRHQTPLVNLLEKLALFACLATIHVSGEFLLGHVEHLDAQLAAGLCVRYQPV